MSEADREDAEAAAAVWIARRGMPDWDADAFAAWLGRSASHRVAYYRLNAAWLEAGRLEVLRGDIPESVARSRDAPDIDSEISEKGPDPHAFPRTVAAAGFWRLRWRQAAAIGAGVVVIVIGAVAFRLTSNAHPGVYATQVGGLEYVPLSDGSRITLNTDSEIRVSMVAHERKVTLDHGEAYFEVAKDKFRPFVVSAGGKRVVAVGTAFSVRRDGDDIQVVVDQGAVRLHAQHTAVASDETAHSESGLPATSSQDGLILPAGSVAHTQLGAVLVKKEGSAEIEQHLSWRSGQLTFRDMPLSQAVEEFNRYNTRKIVIEDTTVAELRLGGVFRSTDIDPFIALLEQGFPVRARAEGNRIVLTHN